MFAKLDHNKNVTKCSFDEFVKQDKSIESRTVQKTYLAETGVEVTKDDKWFAEVSTVFLRIEHNDGLYFETMIFSNESMIDQYCDRYATWNEAVAGHQVALQKIKEHLKDHPGTFEGFNED